VGLFSRKKTNEIEKERVSKMVIEETEKQISDLRSRLADVPSSHREQVERYIRKLEEKKRKIEEGTFYK
jgi:hypothetical protein